MVRAGSHVDGESGCTKRRWPQFFAKLAEESRQGARLRSSTRCTATRPNLAVTSSMSSTKTTPHSKPTAPPHTSSNTRKKDLPKSSRARGRQSVRACWDSKYLNFVIPSGLQSARDFYSVSWNGRRLPLLHNRMPSLELACSRSGCQSLPRLQSVLV